MRRKKTTTGLLAIAALGLLAPAGASAAVRPGHNVTVFHTIDFVATFGLTVGQPATVEVFRGPGAGVLIASATGPAVSTPDGGALEVNHGPLGAPQPGDCWSGTTADILPGDRVVVTDAGGSDEVLVDAIDIESVTESGTDIVVRGSAFDAAGTPIGVAGLAGEVRGDAGKYRANPTTIAQDAGGPGTFVAIYSRPYAAFRNVNGLDADQAQQAILGGDHDAGYGHLAPLPPITQLGTFNVATPNANGPALGCEGSPAEGDSILSADDAAVNVASGDLVLSGSKMSSTNAVTVSLSDGAGHTVGPLSPTLAGNDWTLLVPRADLMTLTDGTIKASGQFDHGGTQLGGRTLSLRKDVVAPAAVTPSLAPGTYVGARSVALSAGAGELIARNFDGGPVFHAYTGAIALNVGATSITTRAADAAGNTGPTTTFTYTIVAPTPAPPAGAGGAPAPASQGGSPVATAPNGVLRARSLVVARNARVRTIRRRGLAVSFVAPARARVARVSLRNPRTGRTIASRTVALDGHGRYVIRFSAAGLRALKAGTYVFEVRVGTGRTLLGPVTQKPISVRR